MEIREGFDITVSTVAPRYNEVSRYRKNVRYSGVTKLKQAEQWDRHHEKQSTDLRVNSYIKIKQSFESQSFPILTNRSRVCLINHLYHHVVFTE